MLGSELFFLFETYCTSLQTGLPGILGDKGTFKNCIGRDWGKSHVLSVASRSVICRSQRLRQISDLRDTDNHDIFTITEYNNCFIIRSPNTFSYLYHSLTAAGKRSVIFHTRAWLQLCMSRMLLAAKLHSKALCMSRPLFVGSYLQVTWWALGQWKGRKNSLNIFGINSWEKEIHIN